MTQKTTAILDALMLRAAEVDRESRRRLRTIEAIARTQSAAAAGEFARLMLARWEDEPPWWLTDEELAGYRRLAAGAPDPETWTATDREFVDYTRGLWQTFVERPPAEEDGAS